MRNEQTSNWLNLDNTVCVITGAAGGIGSALAAALLAQNARVVLLDRDHAACDDLAARLGQQDGHQLLALGCDIADPASVERAARQVEEQYGAADVLINNASVLQPGGVEQISLAQWNQVLAVNLTGYLLCSQAFGRAMLARQRGRIVHIASIAAHYPQTCSGAYSAAKAGVAMLSRQIAAEWGPRGIRSNVICPGLIRTPMSAAFYADPAVESARIAMTANRRIGAPQDVADAALFLSSPRSDYVNGAEITVDGGLESMLMDLIPRPGFSAAPAAPGD